MTSRVRKRLNVAVLLLLFALGAGAAAYVLVHERFPVPFRATYDVQAELAASDGVVPGLGQPVNVAGVQVGSIVGARVADGVALLTLQIQRHQVPHVYANANVALDPVTPLGDVEINLSPGGRPARTLATGGTIGAGQTTAPVPLSDLVSSLDTDTRSWLQSLIASLGTGTSGQGENLRRALSAIGPSAGQLRQIADALAQRRRELAGLVHNLAVLTRAASQDGQLPLLVAAGDRTMHALASQDAPLQQSIRLLPGSLSQLDTTLVDLRSFSGQLTPTLDSLMPAVRRLPLTLARVRPFVRTATAALAGHIRPLVVKATPPIRTLGPAVSNLTAATPSLTSALQVLNYFANELAYNPGGRNQGFLYWADWFFHNWNSALSEADANGLVPRANILTNCDLLSSAGSVGSQLASALGMAKAC
jgi:phospholipid/cholesterol/gamma-HCH transport system substrate-binding protein